MPPRHYIYAKKNGPGDVFRQFAERAKSEPGWKYWEIDASHNPHITCPDVLMALLTQIMACMSERSEETMLPRRAGRPAPLVRRGW